MFPKFLKKKVSEIKNSLSDKSGKWKKVALEAKMKKKSFNEKILRESVDRDISAI